MSEINLPSGRTFGGYAHCSGRAIADGSYAQMMNFVEDAKKDIAHLATFKLGHWQTIETAPKDGSHFLAFCVDLVDEYDERDRLIERGKAEEYICVAYHIDWLGGTVQFPFTGGIVRNRRFTHWMPLPSPPESFESGANAAANSPALCTEASPTRTGNPTEIQND